MPDPLIENPPLSSGGLCNGGGRIAQAENWDDHTGTCGVCGAIIPFSIVKGDNFEHPRLMAHAQKQNSQKELLMGTIPESPAKIPDYLFITSIASTDAQKQMNEAAGKGFRFLALTSTADHIELYTTVLMVRERA